MILGHVRRRRKTTATASQIQCLEKRRRGQNRLIKHSDTFIQPLHVQRLREEDLLGTMITWKEICVHIGVQRSTRVTRAEIAGKVGSHTSQQAIAHPTVQAHTITVAAKYLKATSATNNARVPTGHARTEIWNWWTRTVPWVEQNLFVARLVAPTMTNAQLRPRFHFNFDFLLLCRSDRRDK